ncbi:hypothetical protein MUK42_23644 [Musa troglodytarum]|uniref:Uncharacterized protein n=1 Tax=Musa troglodytarum TaxID=320322 RepID=A0A9E7ERK1_9LILI|nr:hypothetical protein MUK42_23644 [Musa troglodytarum]
MNRHAANGVGVGPECAVPVFRKHCSSLNGFVPRADTQRSGRCTQGFTCRSMIEYVASGDTIGVLPTAGGGSVNGRRPVVSQNAAKLEDSELDRSKSAFEVGPGFHVEDMIVNHTCSTLKERSPQPTPAYEWRQEDVPKVEGLHAKKTAHTLVLSVLSGIGCQRGDRSFTACEQNFARGPIFHYRPPSVLEWTTHLVKEEKSLKQDLNFNGRTRASKSETTTRYLACLKIRRHGSANMYRKRNFMGKPINQTELRTNLRRQGQKTNQKTP